MSRVIDAGLPMEIMECPTCHMTCGIPRRFLEDRRKDGETFWCPDGHAIEFKDGENAKLQKALDAERAACESERLRRKAAEGSLRSTRGVVTRLKKKALASTSGPSEERKG